MAMFRKAKPSKSPPPGFCERCRRRGGVAYLSMTTAQDEQGSIGTARGAWICQQCLDEVHPDAADN